MAASGGKGLVIQSNKACLKIKPHNFFWIYPKITSFYKTVWSPSLFTPTFQYFYTDISAISVTFCNSWFILWDRSSVSQVEPYFMYRYLRCTFVQTKYGEDILALLDSCDDRSLFLFAVWRPPLPQLPNYTWTFHHLETRSAKRQVSQSFNFSPEYQNKTFFAWQSDELVFQLSQLT